MKAVPPSVVTLWLPAIFLVGLFLFLNGLQPQYWTTCIPIVPLLAYMNTLAEVRYSGGQIRIKRWWGSMYVLRSEILDVSPSLLKDVGRLHLRRFMPPWGVIYFVIDWSTIELPHIPAELRPLSPLVAPGGRVPDLIASVLMGASGFVLGRVLSADSRALLVTGAPAVISALMISGILATLFVLIRKESGVLANVLLFLATLVVGLVRESHL